MKKITKKTAVPAVVAAAPSKKGAPVKKKPTAQPVPPATFISAKIDIGFGNVLFLRGEGPGLSWDKGLPMECIGPDLWSATLTGATAPITFKVLVNDLTWNTGSDYVVEPGQSVTITPTF
jgi:hypothetical protein